MPRNPGDQPSAVLTREALQRLQQELDELRSEGRARMADRLQHAREFGDISENAEYDAAKNEQGLMEARIRHLERQLRDPEIMEAATGEDVAPGTLVTVRPLDDDDPEEETYLVALSPEERAPGVRTVTSVSPLGAALLGRHVGDQVTFEAPGGKFEYRIVAVEPHRAR